MTFSHELWSDAALVVTSFRLNSLRPLRVLCVCGECYQHQALTTADTEDVGGGAEFKAIQETADAAFVARETQIIAIAWRSNSKSA